jgi:hypothetical protein
VARLRPGRVWRSARQGGAAVAAGIVTSVSEGFDPDEMIARFRERAAAVRRRGMPPVEGAERQKILRQMQLDFQDFAMLADAVGSFKDGVLTLRIDLRPGDGSGERPSGGGSEQGERPSGGGSEQGERPGAAGV